MSTMSQPLIDALLVAVRPLPYPDRMRLLARRARELASTGEIDGVLAGLRDGGDFQREIGLFLAEVAGHVAVVRMYLDDPSWRLRQRALSFVLRAGGLDAATVIAYLADAPAQVRRQVTRGLQANAASHIADSLVDQFWATFGDAEAAGLLAACGEATVARLLPALGHAVSNWAAVTRRHPKIVLAEAERQLAQLTESGRTSWWQRRAYGVLAAGEKAKMPDMPEKFLPTVAEEQAKKKRKKDKSKQPEVVGQRGYQKPPQPPQQP